MSSDRQLEIYRQHRVAQDKHTYFLLAAAGAAIGFAVNQTHEMKMSFSQIPLAAAVFIWGFSFFFGCKQLSYVVTTLYDNGELLRIEDGNHPMIGRDPQLIMATTEFVRKSIEDGTKRVGRYTRLQFRALITGAIFYLGWHIWEMWLRA